jgi:pyruvate/2-oxoglutarate dehydrogenase complex dihydrolipoamide acyltransferase (E2) component
VALKEVKMPDLSTNDPQVKVLRWLIEVGQPVERGQALVEVETDKAITEVESIATGVVQKICAEKDELIDVGRVIAIIETS